MVARIVPDGEKGRADAVRVLRDGGLVALPTDTVYGLAADAAHPAAIDRLFVAKERPADRAIVLLLADREQGRAVASWPPSAEALAAAFWPGGLTIVVPQRARSRLPIELTGGRATIGLRLPDHPAPRALAVALGPLPVTSANRSGEPEAPDADAIRDRLGAAIDLILDGGSAPGGPASTVVDCAGDVVRILRPGAISRASIAACLASAGLRELAD